MVEVIACDHATETVKVCSACFHQRIYDACMQAGMKEGPSDAIANQALAEASEAGMFTEAGTPETYQYKVEVNGSVLLNVIITSYGSDRLGRADDFFNCHTIVQPVDWRQDNWHINCGDSGNGDIVAQDICNHIEKVFPHKLTDDQEIEILNYFGAAVMAMHDPEISRPQENVLRITLA